MSKVSKAEYWASKNIGKVNSAKSIREKRDLIVDFESWLNSPESEGVAVQAVLDPVPDPVPDSEGDSEEDPDIGAESSEFLRLIDEEVEAMKRSCIGFYTKALEMEAEFNR